MDKYGLGWSNNLRNAHQEKWVVMKVILNVLFAFIVCYLIIGGFSFLLLVPGSQVEYMPFWHEPWRWIFQLIETGKEVIPVGNGTSV